MESKPSKSMIPLYITAASDPDGPGPLPLVCGMMYLLVLPPFRLVSIVKVPALSPTSIAKKPNPTMGFSSCILKSSFASISKNLEPLTPYRPYCISSVTLADCAPVNSELPTLTNDELENGNRVSSAKPSKSSVSGLLKKPNSSSLAASASGNEVRACPSLLRFSPKNFGSRAC